MKATAHELAPMIYTMLCDETEHAERSIDEFENEYRQRKIEDLCWQARAAGCILFPETAEAIA